MKTKCYLPAVILLLVLPVCRGLKPRLNLKGGGEDMNNSQGPPFSYVDKGAALAANRAEEMLHSLKEVIYFKPPVGIVVFLCALRLLYTGRIFRFYDDDEGKLNSAADVLQASERRQRHRRRKTRHERAQDLDKDDMAYDTQGGVESVRGKLCDAVLRQNLSSENPALTDVLAAIRVTYQCTGTAVDYVKGIADRLILAESVNSNKPGKDSIFEMAQMVVEIRALDAMLRVSRDRLLTTSSRLKRLVKHWTGRVRMAAKMGPLLSRLLGVKHMQADRARLALAQGAYKNEIERLGKTLRVRNDRPGELSESGLVEALALSRNATSTAPPSSASLLSKLAIRWNAEDRGQLTIRYFEQNTYISSEAARSVLQQQGDVTAWNKAAREWINDARVELCDVLQESVEKDIVEEGVHRHVTNMEAWCNSGKPRSKDQWNSVLELVDHLDAHQRVGEGTVVSLTDPKVIRWIEDIDVFGIPSSLFMIGLARLLHGILEPKWQTIQSSLQQGYEIVCSIVLKRVWSPLRDIFVDLVSRKNQSLLEFFDVTNEVASLDNMLRDLGFGDGTEKTRQEALTLATRRYEKDLEEGLISSAIRGRLPRLLLVQVQQLKAGLLHALDAIDALVAANRLNVQLLAAVPAVLIITLGARFAVRSFFTFRLKAIRSIRDVHAEMSDYLDDMEKCLLLGVESDMELGAFVLDVHSYLVLLDYSSAVFPARSLDAIHKSMQDMLSGHRGSIGTDRHVQVLRLVKEKHNGLLRYL